MDETIDIKRKEILDRISGISSMRKGVVSDYYVKTKLKSGESKNNGPYYSLTSKGPNGKTIGENIPSNLVEFIKTETENYKLFRELSDEYIDVCVQQSISITSSSAEVDKAKNNKKSE
jgi:hypothetical protein